MHSLFKFLLEKISQVRKRSLLDSKYYSFEQNLNNLIIKYQLYPKSAKKILFEPKKIGVICHNSNMSLFAMKLIALIISKLNLSQFHFNQLTEINSHFSKHE